MTEIMRIYCTILLQGAGNVIDELDGGQFSSEQ
jgi:hypothetical protein